MPERVRTDLWEPQGSNPLGPPGREPRVSPEPRLKRYGKQVGPLTPGTVWTFSPVVQLHECAQRLGHMNQHIQGFVSLPLGATHVKTPKTRKSDWLVVRSDWMPACR